MKIYPLIWISFLFSFLFISNSFSQSINFKRYGIEQGIKHPTVYTINQDKSGFILLGTGAGVSRFDGINFVLPKMSDTISNTYANSSFRDNIGNVWFGFGDGSIYCYKSNKLKKIFVPTENSSVINAFTQNDDGNIIAASQNAGLFFIENDKVTIINKGTEEKLIFAIHSLYSNIYLIGASDGLWIAELNIKEGSVNFISKVKQIPSSKVQCIVHSSEENSFWIGTDDSGVFKLKKDNKGTSYQASQIGAEFGLQESNVQCILEDYSKNLWICTFGEGVHKLNFDPSTNSFNKHVIYNESNGLGDNYIKSAFIDAERNIWFGTYSVGISGIIDEAFVYYNFKADGFENDIQAITSHGDYFWVGVHNGLNKVDAQNGKVVKSITSKNGLPSDDVCALVYSSNSLFIGTKKNGAYKLDVNNERITRIFSSSNSLENKINDIVVTNEKIWLATNGGVFTINQKTGTKEHFSTNSGLPHNKINALFADQQGLIWVATKSNELICLNYEKQYKIDYIGELEFTDIVSDKQGNLWASTYGDGIFLFKKDTLIHLNEEKGLASDYVYSLLCDKDGNVWSGHRLAICKISPVSTNIVTYGTEIGINGDCNPNSCDISSEGTIRFGTTNGIIQYNYLSNQQSLSPPIVNLTSFKIADVETDFSEKITLPYGKYRLRFEFVGLNYRAPAAVKYQYKLDGWENEWSELSENNVANYPRVEDGNYKFLIKAYNADGLSTAQPFSIEITIKPPLWKRWWFIVILVITLVWLVYFIIKYRERQQKQFQEYLQKLLDERTREVVEQKEEIENKNRDITDSITYAQRIQASILPSIKRLHDTFSGCFIFYSPRDIVSGDFYWFDRISDSKFVIVCGDSTGHGVPGALMSMIGTTLIKDICNRPDVVSPSNILEKLDEEMRLTLNQNLEAEKSSDGMDMIACEIDIQKYIVRVASAMRPIIIYQNGEQIYVAGSKSSIGGNEFASECKDFENKEFQLSKGDLIYMFSDGYPDQFGGPMGKKFKMVRLRNLLRDIHELPMEEQYHHVKNTFNLWRDQLDQVDDVLFMGIRL